MRALLDENMPKALVRLFAPEIEARTVQQEDWRGRENGDLLAVASKSFDLFITTDRGIPHQQNLNRYAIEIVLLEARSNRAEDLAPLVPKVKERLRDLATSAIIRLSV
jgi:predicted nuclease of predicted toxin-antitoxin system